MGTIYNCSNLSHTVSQVRTLTALEELIGPGVCQTDMDFDLWLRKGIDLGLITMLEAKCIHEELFFGSFPEILGY